MIGVLTVLGGSAWRERILIYVVVWTFQDAAAGTRRGAAGPRRTHAGGRPSHCARRTPRSALSRWHRNRRVRPRLLLGGRAQVLGDAWSRFDRCRLCRWLHPEPDLRGGLFRSHGSRGGGAGGLRLGTGELSRPVEGLLGEPRPNPGHAAGQ